MLLKERLSKPKNTSALQSRLSGEKKTESNFDIRAVIALFVKEEIVKLFNPITAKVIESIDVDRIKESVRPKKGKDYYDGVTPTDNELRSLIIPLIPEIEDGKTPTKEELLKLIKPLIPKVKDGETPSDARLLRIIKPLIPKPIKGDDGSPDTAEQVVEKVNKAKGVSISSVENLEEELKKIRQRVSRDSIKAGGGGMGNAITQTTAISSATSTITLDYNVASNGKAIWFNYQGQQQAYDTHFTVLGKTITLLFTPSDGTFADLIYIRK